MVTESGGLSLNRLDLSHSDRWIVMRLRTLARLVIALGAIGIVASGVSQAARWGCSARGGYTYGWYYTPCSCCCCQQAAWVAPPCSTAPSSVPPKKQAVGDQGTINGVPITGVQPPKPPQEK
jgi:hypothetical protein